MPVSQVLGLSTTFDNQLAKVLTPALWNCEMEEVMGRRDGIELVGVMDKELFTAAIFHTIPDGNTLEAIPINCTGSTPSQAFNDFLKYVINFFFSGKV